MVLLYITYAFIFVLWAAIRLASRYESARESKPLTKEWMDICEMNGDIIGGFWYFPDD